MLAGADDPRPGRPRRTRWLAAGALALLAIAAGVVVALSSGGSAPHAPAKAAATGHSHRTGTRAGASTTTSHAASSSATAGAAPTTTAGSTSSTPATGAVPGGAGTPVSAVESFYGLAAGHHYAQAWALADPAMQSQLGGYDSFQSGQAGDRSITFTSAKVVNQTPSSARVAITTTSVRNDGTKHCSGTVDLVPGASSGQWQLHQIGINCT